MIKLPRECDCEFGILNLPEVMYEISKKWFKTAKNTRKVRQNHRVNCRTVESQGNKYIPLWYNKL